MLGGWLHAATGAAKATKLSVLLELILPDGARPQLGATEGYTGTVSHEAIGKIGMTPSHIDPKAGTATIQVLDASETPMKLLEEVKLKVKGEPVALKRNPAVSIRLLRIDQRK
jgi:hypothetical protein